MHVNTDFLVIGSGPAGSVLSYFLAKQNFNVSIVDVAHNKKNKKQTHQSFIKKQSKNYTPQFSGVLGGNSELWASKVWLMSKDYFDEKKWMMSYDELLNNSEELSEYFGIEHNSLINVECKNKVKQRSACRPNFNNLFEYLNIENNTNIEVYEGFSPNGLSKKNGKIVSVTAVDLTGNEVSFDINQSLIFCAGGINNPRLLLNLIKDCNDNVGKYLVDHPHINLGDLGFDQLHLNSEIAKPYLLKHKNPFACEGNAMIDIDGIEAGIQLDGRVDVGRLFKKSYLKSKNPFIINFIKMIEFFFRKNVLLFYKITRLTGMKSGYFSYEFFFSQTSGSNKVELSKEKDAYGLYKSNIFWRVSKKDEEIYNKIIRRVIPKNVVFKENSVLTGYHPSSTTIIGKDKETSVVDSDLRLHGISNIYVCGSSVFPTCGAVNPTWTIMTLAYRLSKHLSLSKKNEFETYKKLVYF